ncbi:helix-turn-helix domain-containing protein [Nocardia vinacea]|uniref:helix-turn-helix domain-containing protein n=1 Tax=Nocardia vinacea TaxID=96468 RepID=UPI0003052AAD|nr:transcriptional regulator [Nocardia vinacea]
MVDIEWAPAEVRALREAMRRSPLEFARIVGVTKRTLSLWESGQTSNMHESSKRLLYQVLEDATDDAKQRFWTTVANNSRTGTVPRPSDGDLLLATADESASLLAWAETTNVGPLTIKDLRDNLRWVTREYLKSPTLPLFQRVVRTRDRAIELLQGRQRPQQSAELYAIAGWSMTILGWITTDLGNADIAERHLRTAWALAENTEDNELRAWIRAAQNTAAAWRGEYDDAADAATDGLTYATTGTAALILASARAIDLAHLGRARESAAATQEALDIAARLTDEPQRDQFTGPFSCSIERAGGYWADTALVNGDPAKSIEFATTALDQFRSAAPPLRNLGSERMVRCQRIKGYIALGDLDVAGAELAGVAATTPAEHRVGPLMQRVDEIAQLARDTAGRTSHVSEIVDAATAFRQLADLGNLPALAAGTNGD